MWNGHGFTDKDKLVCYGCAHSAGGVSFPGQPSGERPCGFCVRNRTGMTGSGTWYDGTPPVRSPMDCYQTIDMVDQHRDWKEQRRDPRALLAILEGGDVDQVKELLRAEVSIMELLKRRL
jgi:hypothetical protein